MSQKITETITGKVVNIYLYGDFSHQTMLVLLDEKTGKLYEIRTYIEKSVAKKILLNNLVEVKRTKNEVELEDIKISEHAKEEEETE